MNLPVTGRVLIRATNWLGDAVMSLPAIRQTRRIFPRAHIAVQHDIEMLILAPEHV